MTEATILMTLPPEKRKEILQTCKAILGPIRLEHGCLGCNCYVDIEAEEVILFREEWKTGEDFNAHLASVYFHVLIGAMKLLKEEPTISVNTIASTAGAEILRPARP